MIAILLSEKNIIAFTMHTNKLQLEYFDAFLIPFGYKINRVRISNIIVMLQVQTGESTKQLSP